MDSRASSTATLAPAMRWAHTTGSGLPPDLGAQSRDEHLCRRLCPLWVTGDDGLDQLGVFALI